MPGMSTPRQERTNRIITSTTQGLGSPPAIILAVVLVLVWLMTGPLFGFSDTWQLLINTPTTVIGFVVLFVILAAQNRDGRAIQVKLDALLAAQADADNTLVGVEDLPEPDIKDAQDAQDALRAEVTDAPD